MFLGLKDKITDVIDAIEVLIKHKCLMVPQIKAKKLLKFNPDHFTGNCELVIRKLAKFTKTFMYEKDFEISKKLLDWIIKLCYNVVDEKRKKRLLLVLLKHTGVFELFTKKRAFNLNSAILSCAADCNNKLIIMASPILSPYSNFGAQSPAAVLFGM